MDVIGERTTSYEDFASALPENDCRFAVFDFDYMTPEDVPKSKIYYIFWYIVSLFIAFPSYYLNSKAPIDCL